MFVHVSIAHNVFGGSLHTVFPPVQYIFVFDHYWQSLRIFISYPAMNAVHCMQSQTKTARRQNVNRSHFIGNRRLTDLWICIHIVVFCASRPNVHGILILIKDNDAMILDVINENENAPFMCVWNDIAIDASYIHTIKCDRQSDSVYSALSWRPFGGNWVKYVLWL